MVNRAERIFAKNGTVLTTVPLNSFFNTSDVLSDPKILYDKSSQRWVASIADQSQGSVFLAFSNSSNPATRWNIYAIPGVCGDQPLLGISSDKVVISTNEFPAAVCSGGILQFLGAEYWVLNKNQLVQNLNYADYVSFGPNPSLASVYPVQSLNPTSIQFMVSTGSGNIGNGTSANKVQLFEVSGVPPGSVTSTVITFNVSAIVTPPFASQPPEFNICPKGTTYVCTIDTSDYRVRSASWLNGKLWFGVNAACPNGGISGPGCLRLFEIDTARTSLIQDFYYGVSSADAYYPSIGIDPFGNINIVYAFSSSNIYPSIAATGQSVGDLPDTLAYPTVIMNGTASDSAGCVSLPCRFGDYFGAGADPNSPGLVWLVGEYYSSLTWSTYIASTKMVGYGLTSSPTYLTIAAGSSQSSSIILTSFGGLTGSATMSATTTATGVTVSMNPSSVQLPANKTATSTLTVSASAQAANGQYNATVTATIGSISVTAVVLFVVGPDFSLSMNNNRVTMSVGTSGSSTLTVNSLNSFSGTLHLSASTIPSGLVNVSLGRAMLTLGAGGQNTTVLTVTAGANVGASDYLVTITAQLGSTVHAVSVVFSIQDYGVAAHPSSISLPFSSSASSAIDVVSVNSFQGSFSLTLKSLTPGISVSLNPTSSALGPNGTVQSTLMIITNSTVIPGIYTISINSTVTLNGRLLQHSTSLAVTVPKPDFSISSVPSTINFPPNSSISTNATVSLLSLNKFSGNVSLTPKVSGAGITAQISPNQVQLAQYGSKSSVLTISDANAAPGSYAINVTGISGTLVHSIIVNVNVQDFGMTSNPSSLTVATSSSGSSQIIVNGIGQFNGTVSLTLTVSSPGLTATLSPTSVTVANEVHQSTLTVIIGASTPVNSFTVTITGLGTVAGKTVTHSTTVTVTLPPPDFTIMANPAYIGTLPGGTTTSSIVVTSINNFVGNITFTSSTQSGISASVSPSPLSLSSGNTKSTVLTVNGSTRGNFTVTITGTSGSLVHQTVVTVTIAGLVCLADVQISGNTPCPSTSWMFNGPVTASPTQLEVGVYVQASASINNFDITLVTNTSVLVPVGVNLSGSIFPSNSYIGSECFGAQVLAGSTFCGLNEILLGVTGLNGFSTPNPTGGLLFNAVFKITGASSASTIGFKTGCSNTSVLPNYCVQLSSQTNTIVPEAILPGVFASGNTSFPTLSSNPNSFPNLLAGSTGTSTVTAIAQNGFSGPLSMSLSQSGLSAGLSSYTIDLTNSTSGSRTLTVSGTVGSYSQTVLAQYSFLNQTTQFSSALFATTTVLVTIQDYSLSINLSPIIFNAGSSATAILTVTSLNGFAGVVRLSSISIPTGLTVTFNPANVTLPAGGSVNSTVTFTSTIGNNYHARLEGIVGSHIVYLKQGTITVEVQDFSIAGIPTSLIVNAASSGMATITVTSLGSFVGSLSLSASTSSTYTTSFSVISLVLKSGGSNSSLLTITGLVVGNYTVTVSGTSGSLSHSTSIQVRIVDFGFTSSQTIIVFSRGSSSNATISLTSLNGFNATVTLNGASIPTGPTAAFIPASVTVRLGGTGFSTLILSATTTVATGLYTVTLTGTSGSVSHTVTLIVAVSPVPFRISDKEIFTGVNVTTIGTLYLDSPGNSLTFSGILSVVAINGTTKAPIFAKNYTLTHQPLQQNGSGQYFTRFVLDIAATSTPLGSDITLNLSAPTSTTPGNPSTSMVVSRNPDVLQRGLVDIVDIGFVQSKFNCVTGQSCYDPRADVANRGIIDIVDITLVDNFFNAIDFNQLLFNLTASQYSLTLQAGQPRTITITSASIGGFSGTVNLSTISSSGLGAVLNQTTINVNHNVRLTLTANSAGNYAATITGVAEGESHSIAIAVKIVDFSITAYPTSLTIVKGSSATSIITLTSLNGFSGNVTLSATVSPVVTTGPVVTFTPASLVLTSNGSNTSTLKISTTSNTPKGTYTITVTAANGSLVHTMTITITVTS